MITIALESARQIVTRGKSIAEEFYLNEATSPPDDRPRASPAVAISLVVPLHDEEDNVLPLYEAVTSALNGPEQANYELILVDDGSRDATLERCAALVARDPRVRVVELRRNFGQTAAMRAGIDLARGKAIVTLDGDLQNDPSDIPMMLRHLDQGYDLVIGWRKKRLDGSPRVLISKVANRIIARIMGVTVKDSGCSLKAYRASLIKTLPMYGEMHRFIPPLSKLANARMMQVEVKHHPRLHGVSKYGFSRIQKVTLDIVSIRSLLLYAKSPNRWLLWPVLLSGGAGSACLMALSTSGTGNGIVLLGIAVLLIALSVSLAGWTIIAQLFAIDGGRMKEFATLKAFLSADPIEQRFL